jgi:hypothetical protein
MLTPRHFHNVLGSVIAHPYGGEDIAVQVAYNDDALDDFHVFSMNGTNITHELSADDRECCFNDALEHAIERKPEPYLHDWD